MTNSMDAKNNKNMNNAASSTITNNDTTVDELQLLVLQDLRNFLKRKIDTTDNNDNSSALLFDTSTTAVPVAAIKTLLNVVQRSTSETMMGLQDELKMASEFILQYYDRTDNTLDDTSYCNYMGGDMIALQSGCELFLKYVTRTFLELSNFSECRRNVLERGEQFHTISITSRERIAQYAKDFVPQNGGVVVTHGLSRVVASILYEAKYNHNKQFDVILLEGRPDASGIKAAQYYSDVLDIPSVTVVLDSCMGYIMEQCDIVLIGAEGVMENGGIINKIGTLALATCANAFGKPVYVAVESYKFARLYPLSQSDIPSSSSSINDTLEFVDTTRISKKRTPKSNGTKKEDSTNTNNDIVMTESITTSSTMTTTVIVKDEECDNESNMQRTHQNQQRLAQQKDGVVLLPTIQYNKDKIQIQNPLVDFTPAKFITLLFTDLGVLTPSAVSDELIRLYQ